MRTYRIPTRWIGVLAAGVLLAACAGDGHRAPVAASTSLDRPATLSLSIQSPAAELGGVLLELSGPGINAVSAADSATEQVFVGAPGADGGPMRVAVVGRALSGALLQIQVAHASDVGSISARVIQASGTSNDLLPTDDLQPKLAVMSGGTR